MGRRRGPLAWESMKSTWSSHRNTLVTKMRGGAGLGPWEPGWDHGKVAAERRRSDLKPGMREDLVGMTVPPMQLEGKARPGKGQEVRS